MKIAIMQPYFLPYIGYWQLINAVDKFVLLDDVNYINRGWINRNRILVNGKENFITIPLIKVSQNKKINEIEISSDIKWKKSLVKTIEFNYKKAKYYSEVNEILLSCINCDKSNLTEYINYSLVRISDYLEIKTEFVASSTVYENENLKAEDRIIDICLKERASDYINPIGGTDLYSIEDFKQKNLNLYFLKTMNIEYLQIKNSFVPWLSIIDVLMFNSKYEVKKMLNMYELI